MHKWVLGLVLLVPLWVLLACTKDEDPSPVTGLSGSLSFSAVSAVDSDLNDPATASTYRSNNNFAAAQNLVAPVILGGYINSVSTGPAGNSFVAGDTVDLIKVDLAAGQQISLTTEPNDNFTGFENDLDLYLYDATGGNELGSSRKLRGLESIDITPQLAPDTLHTFYLGVGICQPDSTKPICGNWPSGNGTYRAAGNYILQITANAAVASQAVTTGLNLDFVPGDIIVKFKSFAVAVALPDVQTIHPPSGNSVLARPLPSQWTPQITKKWAEIRHLTVKAESARATSLFSLGNTTADRQHALTALRAAQANSATALTNNTSDEIKQQTLSAIEVLNSDPDVLYAEPNYYRYPLLTSNDPYYAEQWHYQLINLPTAWDSTLGSSNVIVAVVDSGVLLSHPDLNGQLLSGYDFVSDITNAADGDGRDSDPTDPGDKSSPSGASSFHGTHVAGTIAALSNNNLGVAGIASNSKLLPVRAIGRDGGNTWDIVQAVRFAAGLENESGTIPAVAAQIINLSLGGDSPSNIEQEIYTEVSNAGIFVVAAAGNNATDSPVYPAAYSGVIAVSAVRNSGEMATYSSYGSHISLAAPGGDADGQVLSTSGDDSSTTMVHSYAYLAGTSMAAPHVSGVIALMKSVNSSLTPNDFDNYLKAGLLSDDLGVPGKDDHYGYGLINAAKAVVAAANGGSGTSAPELAAFPGLLAFGSWKSELSFYLSNRASSAVDALQINGTPTSDLSWLTVRPTSVSAYGLGQYTATLNRSGLTPGRYSGTITLAYTYSFNNSSTQGSRDLPVVFEITSPEDARYRNVGQVYVLLQNTNQTSGQFPSYRATLGAGNYQFNIGFVAPGSYRIYAGTDPDNNNSLCGIAEPCGVYHKIVTVNTGDQVRGIDFSVNFNQSLPAGQQVLRLP